MGLLKKIFNAFYNYKPIVKCRDAIARRIDRRLEPIVDKLENIQQSLSVLQEESTTRHSVFSKNQEDLSSQHIKLANSLEQINHHLDSRIIHIVKIIQLSAWHLKVQGERQECIANINCIDSILPDFSRVMALLFKDEPHYDQSYNSLILIELINSYIYDGGIWRLRQEINDFLQPKNNLPNIIKNTHLKVDRPLKILVISGMFPSIEHGGGLRLFDILQGLSKDHEIDLYSVYEQEKDLYSLEMLKDNLKDIWLVDAEQIIDQNVTKNDIAEWLKNIGKDANYYDIIQLEYPHTIYLADSLKQYGRKTGFTFMECLTKSNVIKVQELLQTNKLEEMTRFAVDLWKYAVAEKSIMENADFLVAVTPEDASFLQRLNKRQPYIIPTCISQHEIIDKLPQSNVSAEKGCVAFLGSFGHYPNIDSMLWYLRQIHPLIKNKVPEYKLLIIGAGDTSPLEELTVNDKNVQITGMVPDVIPYIQKASVCILPLITGAGIRGKLNQYSIAGRASVSTSIGNKGLKYEHDKSVIIADQADDFANAVSLLLTDEAKNQQMAEEARIHAKAHFTWDLHLQNLIKIYQGNL